MKQIAQYMPHEHQIFWFIVGCVALYELRTIVPFLIDCMSEQTPDGKKGKGSSKRLILVMVSTGFIYGWLHSIHSNTKLDPYVSTLIVIFLLLGLQIIMPDQAGTLLDKFKSLASFSPPPKQETTSNPIIKTTTTTEVNNSDQVPNGASQPVLNP